MLAITALLVALQGCTVDLETKLTGSFAGINDQFGTSVDIEGDRVVVGAPLHPSPLGGTRGAVYLFEWTGGAWVERQILGTSNQPGLNGRFGNVVSLSGDRLAIGAPAGIVGPSNSGQAYLFAPTGGTWFEETIIDPGEPADGFGYALVLAGDTLLIGAPAGYNASSSTPYKGKVFIFVRVGGLWLKQATLQPHDSSSGDRFGYSVALQGDFAFIGAIAADGTAADSGAVYVFGRSGTTWTEVQKLKGSDGAIGDRFGFSLSASPGRFVVSAPKHAVYPYLEVGAAYSFVEIAGVWSQEAKIVPVGYFALQANGWPVFLEGDLFLLGSSQEGFRSGFFNMFTHAGSWWEQHDKVAPPDAKIADGFAISMAMDGDILVAGSNRHDPLVFGQPLLDAGAAYVYRITKSSSQTNFYCVQQRDPQACYSRIFHEGIPSVSGASAGALYEVWAWDVPTQVKGMLIYGKAGPAALPFANSLLCVNPPVVRTALQDSGSVGSMNCSGYFRYDFNQWIQSGVDPALVAGQQVWLQYWYREPGLAPPNNVGLSGGLTAVICP